MENDQPSDFALRAISARIMRVARKKEGLSQVEIAKALDISQGTLSKYEAGIAVPNAILWFRFCKLTLIDPESVLTGYLDQATPAVLQSGSRLGGFKIPKKYSEDRGLKARLIHLGLESLAESIGEDKLKSHCKKLGIDKDFFLDLDNQIHSRFLTDLLHEVRGDQGFTKDELKNIAKFSGAARTHGVLQERYRDSNGPRQVLETFIKNSRYYDCDFRYKLDSNGKKLILSSQALGHLVPHSNPHLSSDLSALCQLRRSFYQGLVSMSGHDLEQAPIIESECAFKGSDQCSFVVSIA